MALTHKQIQGIIRSHKTKSEQDRKRWNRYKAIYQSRFFDRERGERPTGSEDVGDSEESFIESNNAYAFIDSMIANVCPLNPQVSVNPRRDELRDKARGQEALINDTLHKLKTHEKLWKLATHASIYQRGFIKVVWEGRRNQPKVRVVDPRNVFFDMTAEDWEDIRYIIEVTVIDKAQFDQRVKRKKDDGGYSKKVADRALFAGYPSWLKDKTKNKSMVNEASRDVFQWVTVYEVYDFTTPEGKFYHVLEDCEDPLFEGELPFGRLRNPFNILTFNENLDDLGGMSDIQLIESAQEQLNELDTLELNHAKASIPAMLFHQGAVQNPGDLYEAYSESGQPGSFIGVQLSNTEMRLQEVMMPTPVTSLSPSFQTMKARAQEIISYTLGLPEYSRGNVGGSEIAAEVALAETAQRTRNGRRQKRVYDVVAWLGKAIVGLYEEYMENTEVLYVRLTGRQELMELSRQELGFDLLNPDGLPDRPMEYDFEAVPYSSVENNKLVQLRNIQSTWDALMWGVENQSVDPARLMERLVELLELKNVMMDPEEAAAMQEQAMMQQQMMDPSMMAGGGLPGMEAPPADTMATGAMPAGVEEPGGVAYTTGGPGVGTAGPLPGV